MVVHISSTDPDAILPAVPDPRARPGYYSDGLRLVAERQDRLVAKLEGKRAPRAPYVPPVISDYADAPIGIRDAARILGCTPNTVRRWTDAGRIPHSRTPGNQRRYRVQDLCDVLQGLKQ
jgi:excisionase family DNA binding protein